MMYHSRSFSHLVQRSKRLESGLAERLDNDSSDHDECLQESQKSCILWLTHVYRLICCQINSIAPKFAVEVAPGPTSFQRT